MFSMIGGAMIAVEKMKKFKKLKSIVKEYKMGRLSK